MNGVPAMTGLVLAGGCSTRMGTDKALLAFEGEPLAGRAARLLRTVCAEVLLASGDGRRLAALGLPQVADAVPGAGPLAGIVAGLEAASHPLVAVCACDMPWASPEVFALLARSLAGEPAVVPRVNGRIEPLHGLYAASAAPALRALLEAGERSVHRAVAALGGRVAEEAEWAPAGGGGFARSLNRPGDLARDAGLD